MNDTQLFESYLEHRIQRDNALTPGQKLDVVKQLLEEARGGVIPSGPNSVVRIPLDSPVVQAVLRGEPVSVGDTTVKRKGGVQNLSTGQRLGIMGGLALLVIFLPILLYLLFGSKKETPTPSPTVTITETLIPSETPTPLPTETPIPTEAPTETPVPALFGGSGSPGEEANAPASIEIKGRLFVLQQGKVDGKNGEWNPEGPEWLAGTEVRRVLALPLAQLLDLPVIPGDQVTLRTRNGHVVVYPVTQVLQLTPNEIEAFMSLAPSIIVSLFDPNQVNNPARPVIIGELSSPPEATATPVRQQAITTNGVNLRAEPSMDGFVIAGLPKGTWVSVPYPLQMQVAEGLEWIFVYTPLGNGWVSRYFLSFNP